MNEVSSFDICVLGYSRRALWYMEWLAFHPTCPQTNVISAVITIIITILDNGIHQPRNATSTINEKNSPMGQYELFFSTIPSMMVVVGSHRQSRGESVCSEVVSIHRGNTAQEAQAATISRGAISSKMTTIKRFLVERTTSKMAAASEDWKSYSQLLQ